MFNSGDDRVSSPLRAKPAPSAHSGVSDWAGMGRSHISSHSAASESWWDISFIRELLFSR